MVGVLDQEFAAWRFTSFRVYTSHLGVGIGIRDSLGD